MTKFLKSFSELKVKRAVKVLYPEPQKETKKGIDILGLATKCRLREEARRVHGKDVDIPLEDLKKINKEMLEEFNK